MIPEKSGGALTADIPAITELGLKGRAKRCAATFRTRPQGCPRAGQRLDSGFRDRAGLERVFGEMVLVSRR